MAKKVKKGEKADQEAAELDNQRRELFCRYFTQNDELFNNATLSYAEAYEYKLDELSEEAVYSEPDEKGHREKIDDSEYTKAYNVCSVNGHRLLRSAKIQERIVALRNELLKDDIVDSELSKVIKQNKDLFPRSPDQGAQ